MDKLMLCPICGSKEIMRSEKIGFSNLTMGKSFSFTEINYHCNSCHEEGDFFSESDKYFLQAKREVESKLVKELIELMNQLGITMAMFERAFELPMRTLTRWKNDDFSASALALLRIVLAFPWMVKVAEHKFERNYTRSAIVMAAAEVFGKESSMPHIKTKAGGSFNAAVITADASTAINSLGG